MGSVVEDAVGMSLKRDKIDNIFSLLVRERVDFTCEVSGRYYPPGLQRKGCHCSHLWGRRNTATRYHPDNAFCHSMSAHKRFSENPVEFRDWALETLGGEKYQIVKELANDGKLKFTRADKEELYQHLRKEYKRMEEQRMDGVVGRLEFTNIWFE